MSIFSNLTSEGHEQKQDRLGGFQIFDTDIYPATIKAAYAGKSAGGAQSVTLVAQLPTGEYSETLYVTKKTGENYFLNPNDKSKKVPMMGFAIVDDLCLMTTDKPLSEQDTEEKVVKIYDYDEKKDLPKSVPMLVDLIGKTAFLAIVRQNVDKNAKNESTGEYEPTGETREENVIEKVFHDPSKMSVVEAQQGATEPVFYDKWLQKNKGNTRNKVKGGNAGGNAGRPGQAGGGAPTSGAGGAKKTGSLFNKG